MLRGLFARRQSGSEPGRMEAERIKLRLRKACGISETTGLTVSEIDCLDPACPGVETVILVLPEGGRTRALKIGKPMAEIDDEDLRQAWSGDDPGEPA